MVQVAIDKDQAVTYNVMQRLEGALPQHNFEL